MRSMDGGIWWSSAFEPFYGPEYCQWTNMDLQRLHDGEFRGNSFRFQEGWVVPTVELLRRLSRLGLPIRTRNHILVHLCKPVDAMSPGEFYFQVGHQLPGRLSLKFTRRHPDGTIIIHPTVLELEEERQLGANPSHYLDSLRDTAYRITPADRILTTIILLDIQTGSAKRELCARFLPSVNDPSNFRNFMPSPVDFQGDDRYCSLPCPRNHANRQTRSGSDGNIPPARPRASSVPAEPVENDENLVVKPEQAHAHTVPTLKFNDCGGAVSVVENIAERSLDWVVTCDPGVQRRENQWSELKTSLSDEYTGVRESFDEPSPIGYHAEEMVQIRSHQVSPRTAKKDEYTGVTEAMATMSVRTAPRKTFGEMPVVEEYTSTDQGVSARGPPSWSSCEEPLRDASYLPYPIEQINQMTDRKHSR